MACLRILNSLKSRNVLAQAAGPSIRKLFNLLLPLITSKITMFTDDMLQKWMGYLKSKKNEYSMFLVQQIEDSSRKRFSRMGSRLSTITRESFGFGDMRMRGSQMGRNSMRQSSIMMKDIGRQSLVKQGSQIFGSESKYIAGASMWALNESNDQKLSKKKQEI